MNPKDIDIVNVILILISLTLAFNIPFELFVFSYAFLGPLHYLTEINWLNEKNYFIKKVQWMWLFFIFSFFISVPILFRLSFISNLFEPSLTKKIVSFTNSYTDEVLLIAILFTIGLIYFKDKITLSLFLIISTTVSILVLNYIPTLAFAISVFIPTLVHVYLFTLLFMIYGTLNSKSTPGIIAIVLLILAPLIIIISKINPTEYYSIPDFVRNSYNNSTFSSLNLGVSKIFSSDHSANFSFFSTIGIKIQIFLAFAYTYHYLNWFSKTSIIKWNKGMSKSKAITIISIWVVSIGLYIYNFKVGFVTLSFLSFIHVFLEFPLNVTSIKGILLKIKSQFL